MNPLNSYLSAHYFEKLIVQQLQIFPTLLGVSIRVLFTLGNTNHIFFVASEVDLHTDYVNLATLFTVKQRNEVKMSLFFN